jgi:protein TonB
MPANNRLQPSGPKPPDSVSKEAVMSSTHIVLSSAAAAAVVLGSHYVVEAFSLTRAAVQPSSIDRAFHQTLAQQTAPRPIVPVPLSPTPPPSGSANSGGAAPAQNNPACSPNPLPVGAGANNRPHVYQGPDKISTPTRIVYVRPAYPEAARAAKVQGVVILETQIERDGRVCSARVVRSIPLLDQSAINAVFRWRFTPAKTTVNEVAVPVITTLTVNFTLP